MEKINLNNLIESSPYVSHLENISRHLSIYICLFYLIVGNIGTILKILFFLQKPVRICPCSVYVLAAAFIDFITLNNIPILKLLSSFYPSKNWIHITMSRSILSNKQNKDLIPSVAIKICKIRNYLHMWSTDVSIYLLLFASFNRYLTSSKNSKRLTCRQLTNIFCSVSHAVKISLGTYVIGALISVHHYFNFIVVSNFCIPESFTLWATWIFDFRCLLPSTCMIIFSTLTLMNVRKSSNSLKHPYGNDYRTAFNLSKRFGNHRHKQTNRRQIGRQLTAMIITETTATILTTLFYAIYIMYQAVKIENEKNLESLAREDFIEQLVGLTVYLEPSCGFYVYLFTLTTLRKRFFRLLVNKMRFF